MKLYKHIYYNIQIEFLLKMKNKHNFLNYFGNEDVLKCIKYVELDFKDEIQDEILNNEQLKIFELLIKQSIGLHILEGTPRSGKTF